MISEVDVEQPTAGLFFARPDGGGAFAQPTSGVAFTEPNGWVVFAWPIGGWSLHSRLVGWLWGMNGTEKNGLRGRETIYWVRVGYLNCTVLMVCLTVLLWP